MLSVESISGISQEECVHKYANIEDGFQYEYYDSKVIKIPWPRMKHQNNVSRMLFQLANYFKGKEYDYAYRMYVDLKSECDNKPCILVPDLSVFSSKLDDTDLIDAIPEMVVEVWSIADAEGFIGFMLDHYRKAGVKELISIYPFSKLAIVINLQEEQKVMPCYPFSSIIESELFPGLKFELRYFD